MLCGGWLETGVGGVADKGVGKSQDFRPSTGTTRAEWARRSSTLGGSGCPTRSPTRAASKVIPITDATPIASRAAAGKGVDAGSQESPQRHRQLAGLADQEDAAFLDRKRAVVEQRPHGFADEQRVAAGSVVDRASAGGIQFRAGDDRGELRGLRWGEADQIDPGIGERRCRGPAGLRPA